MGSDVADRLVDAINAHDLDAVVRCYTPRAVGVGPELQVEDPEQIASYYEHAWQGFPDLRLDILEKVEAGDVVVLQGVVTGTHTGPYLISGGETLEGTGRRVNVRCCLILTLEGDLISSHAVYYDQLESYTQLGVRLLSPAGPLG
ncbi:ketosteroid isomerase-like protein [Streptosporangium becharense]|uniref:Ketosteroid isomerase-like protein n=1 Tax=Streptosporangium becharense TaxID=1816182 RepID=A0A7W9MHF8_9ACTN|nr:nuclear transport factor 2 family protein [Streptosporangium becharense]MBB2914714.1 ketosteroid isomerase-like protein [Streptosporangium becharense]MBB5820885.1 ketosteroid isomerase-like protein [Streptosporangium becharense]